MQRWTAAKTSFPSAPGLSFGHGLCPPNAGRFVPGATCTRGPLSSFSQCSAQCEHLHVTSHEPASQLTEPVSAVNRARENTLCASGQSSALAGDDGITHWGPLPLLSPMLPIFTRAMTLGTEGEAGGHRGGGCLFSSLC